VARCPDLDVLAGDEHAEAVTRLNRFEFDDPRSRSNVGRAPHAHVDDAVWMGQIVDRR